MRHLAYSLLLALFVLPVQGQDRKKADPTTPDFVIHLPVVPPQPPTPPDPGAPLSLATGKLLVITSPAELSLKWVCRDTSDLSIKAIKGPLLVFGDFVDPQPKDDEGRLIPDPYIYIVKSKMPGQGTLVITPFGFKDAKQIGYQTIDAGGTPPGPAITISVSPTTATVPIKGTQQFTATASQGGVKWSCTGAGTVDQFGLFTASTAAGSALIVAASTLDSSKTATAAVTVTDQPGPPIPVAGFRVLMVYDKATLKALPAPQRDVLYSTTVSGYLASKCVLGPDNVTPEWRCYDGGSEMSHESKLWQDVMARPRKSLPWIVISTGKTGTEQPLPANVADTLALLKQYGG